jgi:flagellar biosynthetic protein FliR
MDFVSQRDYIFRLFIGSLGKLFEQALIISLPILGTLFLVSITMGLLAKAAPQMNLLMMGFPVAIGVAFLILFLALPFLMEAFGKIIDASFYKLLELIGRMRGASP